MLKDLSKVHIQSEAKSGEHMIPRKKSTSDENDITKRVAGTTKSGRNIVIDQNIQGLYFCKLDGKGSIPKVLKGRFTRYDAAQNAIDSYLGSR